MTATTKTKGGWQVGWRPGDVHVCKPHDLSTWTKVTNVPPPPEERVLLKCKGCSKTMVR